MKTNTMMIMLTRLNAGRDQSYANTNTNMKTNRMMIMLTRLNAGRDQSYANTNTNMKTNTMIIILTRLNGSKRPVEWKRREEDLRPGERS